ncbi:histidine kinase [Flavobacterium sp. CFBP9031]|uniref:sensor histidine kinase n=1 Tax=Flavobacterium sp. CFBP9031 TaxID=3096538 RepID=UPI002A6A233A|nr:histidine kinase [Flavobacterium sp. CFBP9031]MDY0986666.1 histidine kinase [Flavobacterium sp. CFBP9031]
MDKSKSETELKINLQDITVDKLFNGLTNEKYRIIRHILGIVFLGFLLLKDKRWGEFEGVFDHLDWIFSLFFLISLFYINMYKLTPYFIYRGKALLYIISFGMVNLFEAFLLAAFHIFILEPNRLLAPISDFNLVGASIIFTIILTPFLLLSTALKLLQRWIKDIKRIKELEERAIDSELTALRNQIHPHFLFNMLNNINVLTATEPEKASYIIVKLSSFLRHLIYETDRNQIYLSSEIKFITDYLELEKIRRDNFNFLLEYDEKEIKGFKVPPNILIILVENAIKHSADSSNTSFVNIGLKIKDNHFHFTAVNSVPAITKLKIKNSSGAGLVNIKRRLELLFTNSGYELISSKQNKQYSVFLKLPV